jgi:hypothetical protein
VDADSTAVGKEGFDDTGPRRKTLKRIQLK